MMAALTPTTGYFVTTVFAGRPVDFGAIRLSAVPFG